MGAFSGSGGGGGSLKDKIKLITGDNGDLEAGIKLEAWIDRATTQLLLAIASIQPENQRYKGQFSSFIDFQNSTLYSSTILTDYVFIENENDLYRLSSIGAGQVKNWTSLKQDLKSRIDILEAFIDSSADTDGIVNKVAEVLKVFENYPEGVNILQELNDIKASILLKANSSDVYTKIQIDNFLNLKADKTTTYTKIEVDSALNIEKQNITTLKLKQQREAQLNIINGQPAIDNLNIFADGQPATDDPFKRNGFYFKKLATPEIAILGNKINWYFYGGDLNFTLADLKNVYCDLLIYNKTSLPYFTVYTKLQGDGNNASSWYRSKKTYSNFSASVLKDNSEYCFYLGQKPKSIKEKIEAQLSLSEGLCQETEQVLYITLQSDSGALEGKVEFLLRNFAFDVNSIGQVNYALLNTDLYSSGSSGVEIDDTTASTSKVYSSQKTTDLLDLKENVSNKTASLTSPDDIKYPTSKLLKDNLDLKIDKTAIKSSFSTPTLGTNLASEKLVKDSLDLKENTANKATDFTTLNNVKFPTTQAVANYIASQILKIPTFQGQFDASGDVFPTTRQDGTSSIEGGDYWIISVAGVLGGKNVEQGDFLYALIDAPTSSDWAIIEKNYGYTPENQANKVADLTSPNTDKYIHTQGLKTLLDLKENSSNKDATGGYAGLTLLKINIKNTLGTFTSFFRNSATASRTYDTQDRDGTLAHIPTSFTTDNIAKIDTNGNVADSGKKFNDGGTTTNDILSASKVISLFSNAGLVNIINATGGIQQAVNLVLDNTNYKINLFKEYTNGVDIIDKQNLSIEGASNIIRNEDGTTLLSKITGTVNIDSSSSASPVCKNIYLRNIEFNGAFALNKFAGNSKFVFENCVFDNTIALTGNNSSLTTNIKFKDCYFVGNLTLASTLASGVGSGLFFENCNFNSATITNNSTISIIVKDCLNIPSAFYNSGVNSTIFRGNNTVQSTNGIIGYLDWNKGNSYKQNQIVNYQGALCKANSNISTGTNFTTGLSGATWRIISPETSKTIFSWVGPADGNPTSGQTFNAIFTGNTFWLSSLDRVVFSDGNAQGGSMYWNYTLNNIDWTRDLNIEFDVYIDPTADGISVNVGGSSAMTVGGANALINVNNGGIAFQYATYNKIVYTSFINGTAVSIKNGEFSAVGFGSFAIKIRKNKGIAMLTRINQVLTAINISSWTPAGGYFSIGGGTGAGGLTHACRSFRVNYV